MAFEEKALFTLEIKETGGITVKQELEGVEDSLRNIKKEFSQEISTKQFEKLNKIVDESALSIQELGTAADNYKNIALAAGTESPIGKEAIRRAAALEKEIDTLNRRVADLGESGRALRTALDLGSGVVAGYNIAAGAAAFFGDENEELTKTLVKLQAAQSVLMGLQEVKILLDKNGAIASLAYTVAEKAKTAATIAAQGPMVVLNAIMAANPIGLVVVAVGALIAILLLLPNIIQKVVTWFDKLSTAGKIAAFILGGPLIASIIAAREISKLFRKEETDAELEAKKRAREQRERIRERITLLRDEAYELEQLRKQRIKVSDEYLHTIDFEIAKLKAAGEDAAELERTKIEATRLAAEERLGILKQELRIQNEIYLQQIKLIGGLRDNVLAKNVVNKILDEEKAKLKVLSDTIVQAEKEIRDSAERLEIFEIEQRKKNADAAKNAAKEAQTLNEQKEKENIEAFKKAREEETKIITDNLDRIEEIRDKKRNKLIEEGNKLIAIGTERANYELEKAKQVAEEKERIELESAEKRKMIVTGLAQATIDIGNALISFIDSNSRQAADIQKALAVAQIGIDTAKAISGAVAAAQSAGPFPANIFAIITGVSAVLTNIAKARKILMESANVNVPTISAPNISLSSGSSSSSQGFGGQTPNPNFTNLGTRPPITQYVAIVEDINEMQDKVNVREGRTVI